MDEEQTALLKAILSAAKVIVGAALVFLFLQLLADILPPCCSQPQARNNPQGASYPVGLVILLVGAALLVTVAVASRRRPAEADGNGRGGDGPGAPSPTDDGKTDSVQGHPQAEVCLKVTAGVSPAATEPGKTASASA